MNRSMKLTLFEVEIVEYSNPRRAQTVDKHSEYVGKSLSLSKTFWEFKKYSSSNYRQIEKRDDLFVVVASERLFPSWKKGSEETAEVTEMLVNKITKNLHQGSQQDHVMEVAQKVFKLISKLFSTLLCPIFEVFIERISCVFLKISCRLWI